LSKDRGHFHTDEAAADNDRAPNFFRGFTERFRIVERTQVADVAQLRAGNLQRARGGTGGDDQLFECVFFAGFGIQGFPLGVDAGNFCFQFYFDTVFAVKILRADFYGVFRIFASEETFRKRGRS
jgi:hypothetical protein